MSVPTRGRTGGVVFRIYSRVSGCWRLGSAQRRGRYKSSRPQWALWRHHSRVYPMCRCVPYCPYIPFCMYKTLNILWTVHKKPYILCVSYRLVLSIHTGPMNHLWWMAAGDQFLQDAAQRGDWHRRPPFRVSFSSDYDVEKWHLLLTRPHETTASAPPAPLSIAGLPPHALVTAAPKMVV
jgi:hypothetical protein